MAIRFLDTGEVLTMDPPVSKQTVPPGRKIRFLDTNETIDVPQDLSQDAPSLSGATSQGVAVERPAAVTPPPFETPPDPTVKYGLQPLPPRTTGQVIRDLGVSAAKGIVGLPQGLVGLADIPTGGRVGRAIEQYTPIQFKETQDALHGLYSPQQRQAMEEVSQAEGVLGKAKASLERPGTIISSVIESAPSMIGGGGIGRTLLKRAPGALSAIGKALRISPEQAAGALGEGLISMGQGAEQVRELDPEGKLTVKQSAILAGSGTLTGIFGAFGAKIARKLGVADIDALLAGDKATKVKILKGLAGSMLTEGTFEELPQSAQEQIAQNMAMGKKWNEGVEDAMVQGWLAGTAMGGIGGAGGAMIAGAPREPVKRLSPEEAEAWKALRGEITDLSGPEADISEKRPAKPTVTTESVNKEIAEEAKAQKEGKSQYTGETTTRTVEPLTPPEGGIDTSKGGLRANIPLGAPPVGQKTAGLSESAIPERETTTTAEEVVYQEAPETDVEEVPPRLPPEPNITEDQFTPVRASQPQNKPGKVTGSMPLAEAEGVRATPQEKTTGQGTISKPPELMTSEEYKQIVLNRANEIEQAKQIYQNLKSRKMPKDIQARLNLQNKIQTAKETWESLESTRMGGQMPLLVEKMKQGKPINADALEKSGLNPLEFGYTREGGLYIYKPSPETPSQVEQTAGKTPEGVKPEPVKQAEQPKAEVPVRDTGVFSEEQAKPTLPEIEQKLKEKKAEPAIKSVLSKQPILPESNIAESTQVEKPSTKVEQQVKVEATPEGTTISVPAKDKPSITPKEQKKYLLAELDKAIEQAEKDIPNSFAIERERVDRALNTSNARNRRIAFSELSDLAEKYLNITSVFKIDDVKNLRREINRAGLKDVEQITIEVPGDGEYKIFNVKNVLEGFKKRAEREFPATEKKTRKEVLKKFESEEQMTEWGENRGQMPEDRSASDLANELQMLRTKKPRPIEKLYGKQGPTPEQAEKHAKEMRDWNRLYRKTSEQQKEALKRDNAKFGKDQPPPAKGVGATTWAENLSKGKQDENIQNRRRDIGTEQPTEKTIAGNKADVPERQEGSDSTRIRWQRELDRINTTDLNDPQWTSQKGVAVQISATFSERDDFKQWLGVFKRDGFDIIPVSNLAKPGVVLPERKIVLIQNGTPNEVDYAAKHEFTHVKQVNQDDEVLNLQRNIMRDSPMFQSIKSIFANPQYGIDYQVEAIKRLGLQNKTILSVSEKQTISRKTDELIEDEIMATFMGGADQFAPMFKNPQQAITTRNKITDSWLKPGQSIIKGVGAAAAASEGEFVPGGVITGLKRSVAEIERKALGYPEEVRDTARRFPEVIDKAMARMSEVQNLINEIKENPRPLSDVEVAMLTIAKSQRWKARNDAASEDVRLHTPATREAYQKAAESLEEIFDVAARGHGKSITETARGLKALQMMVDDQFNLVEMEQAVRDKQGGKPLSDEQRQELQQLKDDYEKTVATLQGKELPKKEEKKESKESKPAATPVVSEPEPPAGSSITFTDPRTGTKRTGPKTVAEWRWALQQNIQPKTTGNIEAVTENFNYELEHGGEEAAITYAQVKLDKPSRKSEIRLSPDVAIITEDGKTILRSPEGDIELNPENPKHAELLERVQLNTPEETAQVKKELQEYASKLKGARIVIVDAAADLPVELQSEGGKLEGVYHNGTSYIIAENVRPGQAARVIAHEAVVHGGLRAIFTEVELANVLENTYLNKPEYVEKILQKMKQRGIGRTEAIEEIIADIWSQREAKPTLWNRLVSSIRNALRNLGFNVEWSEKDIEGLIARAAERASGGLTEGGRADTIRFSKKGQEDESNTNRPHAYSFPEWKQLYGQTRVRWQRRIETIGRQDPSFIQPLHDGMGQSEWFFRASQRAERFGKSDTLSAPDESRYLSLAERYKSGDKSVEQELQKMVDEKAKEMGYNIGPVWHGTMAPAPFSVFKTRRNRYANRLGAYFTENEDFAKRPHGIAASLVYRVNLNIRNPLDLREMNRDQVVDALGWMGRDAQRDLEIQGRAGQYAVLEWADKRHELVPKLKRRGFDGVVFENPTEGRTWVAFSPSQIKSASPVTYDDAGNIIPLSERFQAGKEDIRFSLEDDISDLANEIRAEEQSRKNKQQWVESLPENMVGGSNQAMRERLLSIGRERMSESERIADQEVVDEAMERIESFPDAGRSLVDELLVNPRPVTAVEQAILDHALLQADMKWRQIKQQIEEDTAKGEPSDTDIERAEKIAMDMEHIALANEKAGAETGRAFRFRQILLNQDFSLSGLRLRMLAAKSGEPVTDAENAKLKEFADKIERIKQEVEQYKTRETDQAVSEERKRINAIIEKFLKEQRNIFSAAAKAKAKANGNTARDRLRAQGIRVNDLTRKSQIGGGFTEDQMTDLAEIGAEYLANSASKSEWDQRMKMTFGTAIDPVLEQLYARSFERVMELRRETQPKPKAERAEKPILSESEKYQQHREKQIEKQLADAKKKLSEIQAGTYKPAEKTAKRPLLLDKKVQEKQDELNKVRQQIKDMLKRIKINGTDWIEAMNKHLEEKGVELPADIRQEIESDFQKAARIMDDVERDKAVAAILPKIEAHVPLRFGDWFDAYVYTNMLSSPLSHLRNIWGNTINLMLTRPGSLLMQGDRKGARRYFLTALGALFNGNANTAGLTAFRAGEEGKYMESLRQIDEGEGGIAQMIGMLERAKRMRGPQNKWAKKLWKANTAIPRFLAAQDAFMGAMIEAGETARLLEKGEPLEIAKARGTALANKYLYRDKLSSMPDASLDPLSAFIEKIGHNLDQIRQADRSRLFKLTIPFVRTPIKIAQFNMEMTLMGYIGANKNRIAQAHYGKTFDQLQADLAKAENSRKMDEVSELEQAIDEVEYTSTERMAKAHIGSFITILGFIMAAAGKTTWGPPPDEKAKRLFYDAGYRPYSFRIGNTWVPMAYLGPLMIPFALGAAVKDTWQDNPNTVNDEVGMRVLNTALAFPRMIFDQLPLHGMATALDALSGREPWKVKKSIGGYVNQMVPASGTLRWIESIVDPEIRKSSSVGETVAANIPFLSENVKTIKTSEGLDAKKSIWDAFRPYSLGTANESKEAAYKSRLAEIDQRLKAKKEKGEEKSSFEKEMEQLRSKSGKSRKKIEDLKF